jgi:hypothetical protein
MKVEGRIVKVQHSPKGGKEWVARLTGKDVRYGFQRVFLTPVGKDWSSTGNTGVTLFELGMEGVYEVNEPWKRSRFYLYWDGSEARSISVEEAIQILGR